MPKIYRPGSAAPKREKAVYGASITFKREEVRDEDVAKMDKHAEIVWKLWQKCLDIGYSIKQLQTGNIKENYSAQCYAQWADMKDGGYTLSVTHCASPYEAVVRLLVVMQGCKFRLDTIQESDVEF